MSTASKSVRMDEPPTNKLKAVLDVSHPRPHKDVHAHLAHQTVYRDLGPLLSASFFYFPKNSRFMEKNTHIYLWNTVVSNFVGINRGQNIWDVEFHNF